VGGSCARSEIMETIAMAVKTDLFIGSTP